MKNLILGDCDRLIKFILFGYEETAENKIDYRHVPSNKSWPRKKILKGYDLNFDKSDDELKMPENNMELAIYYCIGKSNFMRQYY
ncbi:hypothetical protein RhiirA4_408057 [Rhizophagus irregularis]|uniref:Uncharacterized protein n=1 Tax=Rhizophagus irregularis TaxID=588596 RepID=A0A2I1GZU2_9GLOM|nr:hypothetical protein RhiirA4_408057 [Rhizophagus irregularis]